MSLRQFPRRVSSGASPENAFIKEEIQQRLERYIRALVIMQLLVDS